MIEMWVSSINNIVKSLQISQVKPTKFFRQSFTQLIRGQNPATKNKLARKKLLHLLQNSKLKGKMKKSKNQNREKLH